MGQLYDRDKGESFLQVHLKLDAHESLQQSPVCALDGQAELLVHHLRGSYLLDVFALEVEQIAKADIVHLLVPVWNDRVELAAEQLIP